VHLGVVRAIDKLRLGGIRRLGSPKSGFRYVRADGRALRGSDLERVRALRLPPAWTEVHVSPAPGAKLQAIGKDRAGRWQYRYHPEFMTRQTDAKYRRLVRFAGALPRMRARVDADLRKRGLSRERVLAAMVRIIEISYMRPGSERYARENRSYGLTTIRPRHVRVSRDTVIFEYRGKSGQQQLREVDDARVARIVRELLKVPGRDVFQFEEEGTIVDVRRRHLNAYIREISGGPYTAKDFRTWAGTLLCASELARRAAELVPGRTERKKLAAAVVKSVAERLGNTPAVARASYVSPVVLDRFSHGDVIGCSYEPDELGAAVTRGMHRVEDALVGFLAAHARRRPAKVIPLRRGRGRGVSLGRARPTAAAAKPLNRAARGADR
jgi:DNA topoisomerase I